MRPIVDLVGNVRLPEGSAITLTTGSLIGLGDHAVYSTLPKRFRELGYEVFYDADIKARNPEVFDLFWKNNLYLSGPSNVKPNAGYARQGLFYELANRYPIGCIEAMERAHGLPPPYSIAPISCYQPRPCPVPLDDAILVDFSSLSSAVEEQAIAEFLRMMKGRFRNARFVQVVHDSHVAIHRPTIQCDAVKPNGLLNYIDMIAACRAWIGSESGGQSLAAMVRGEHDVYDLHARPEIVVCSTVKTFNSRGYTYRGADYRVTQFGSDKTGDYFFPHETAVHVEELLRAMSYEQQERVRLHGE